MKLVVYKYGNSVYVMYFETCCLDNPNLQAFDACLSVKEIVLSHQSLCTTVYVVPRLFRFFLQNCVYHKKKSYSQVDSWSLSQPVFSADYITHTYTVVYPPKYAPIHMLHRIGDLYSRSLCPVAIFKKIYIYIFVNVNHKVSKTFPVSANVL